MTISTTTTLNRYTGNSVTTVFPYTYRILSAADLVVTKRSASTLVETTLVYPTDYSVSGVGNTSGGSITTTAAPATGDLLVIERAVPPTQPTSIRNQGSYFPETHENVFDRHTMVDQQQATALSRTFSLPKSLDPANFVMALPTPVPGQTLTWGTNGLTNSTVSPSSVTLPGSGRTTATLSTYLANNYAYNVLDYDAMGDGVTDDGPAFAAAEAAIVADGGSGVLYIPKPLVAYRIATQVTVDRSNVVWVGSGFSEIRCAIPNALSFGASAQRIGLRLSGFKLRNDFDTAFQPCLRIYGTSGSGVWQDVTLRDIEVNGQSVKGEGIHLRQVFEATIDGLWSQQGPEVLLSVAAELVNSGNLRLNNITGNSVGAVVVFLNRGGSNTLLNNISLQQLKGVTGVTPVFAATSTTAGAVAGTKVLAVSSTAGMSAGKYVVICGKQYGQIFSVDTGTQLTLRDNLETAVSSGDRVVCSSFLCVAGPNTEIVGAYEPHSETTGVGFYCNAAKNVRAYGLILGGNPKRAMLCDNGSAGCRVYDLSTPGNLATLTFLECTGATTQFNEVIGWFSETGTPITATVLTDSTGVPTNRAARSHFEWTSGPVFDNDAAGISYRNGDGSTTAVFGTDGTHVNTRPRQNIAGAGTRMLDHGGNQVGLVSSNGALFKRLVSTRTALTDGATVNIDASVSDYFTLAAGGSRTIAVPTNAVDGQRMTLELLNNTGGAITTTFTTGANGFQMPVWADPATTKRRTQQFRFDGALSRWIPDGAPSADF